jgi:hypothetical protein
MAGNVARMEKWEHLQNFSKVEPINKIPLQVWIVPETLMNLRLPDFKTIGILNR